MQPGLKARPRPLSGRLLHREPRPQGLHQQDLGQMKRVFDWAHPFRRDERADVEGLVDEAVSHGGNGAEEVDVGGLVGGGWVWGRRLLLPLPLLLLLLLGGAGGRPMNRR